MKPNIYIAHWIDAEKLDFDRQVDIYNVHADEPKNKKAYNILNLSNEPEATRMKNNKVKKLYKLYDLILTWDEDLLESCDNARMFLCGMTWIRRQDYNCKHVLNKKNKVSFLCGSKNLTHYHRVRQEVWNRQREIKIKKDFYHSKHNKLKTFFNNPVIGGKQWEKVKMFDAQFHIAIENTVINNYFTEKIIDCFVTRTVPIYIGCSNLEKYFNEKGVIRVDSADQVIHECNNLKEKTYTNMKPYIEENYKLSQEYARNFTMRLNDVIREHMV